jgi:hypothetical protein
MGDVAGHGFFVSQKYKTGVVVLTRHGYSETNFLLEGAPPKRQTNVPRVGEQWSFHANTLDFGQSDTSDQSDVGSTPFEMCWSLAR